KYAKSPTNHSGPAVVASAVPTVAFSNTCQSLAVIRRRECKDYISIHDPQEGFKQVSHFGLPTVDAYGVVWPSFKDSQLLVWENPSASSTAFVLLYVYSIAGEQLHAVKPPSGSLQSDAVCLTGLALFPQEGLVAVGTAGGQAHILNASTWSLLAFFSHGDPLPVRTTADEGRCFIYRLEDTDGKQARYKVENRAYESFREDSALTTELSHHSRPIIRQNRGMQGLTGIRKLEWSPSGRYLSTRDEGQPSAIYVWCLSTRRLLAVLHHSREVRDFKWDPHPAANIEDRARLTITLGQHHVYSCMISQDGPLSEEELCFKLPRHSAAGVISWCGNGSSLLVRDTKRGEISVITRVNSTGPQGG
ncbi:WD repeat-containing protein wrap73, variant 2, partial [Perkinsus olseni]